MWYIVSHIQIFNNYTNYIETQEVSKDKSYDEFRNNVYKEFEKEFKTLPVYRREELIQATYQVFIYYFIIIENEEE
jgi:hypothetical protein